jgi:hypothetical protein
MVSHSTFPSDPCLATSKKRKRKNLQHPCTIEIPHLVGFLNYEISTRKVLGARSGESVGILSLCNQQDLSVEPALELHSPFLEGSNVQNFNPCNIVMYVSHLGTVVNYN